MPRRNKSCRTCHQFPCVCTATDPDKDAAREPREWFVDRRTLSNKPTGWHTEVTLIEKSAYDALREQLAEMNKNCISLSLHDSRMKVVEDKLTAAEAELQEAQHFAVNEGLKVKRLRAALNDMVNAPDAQCFSEARVRAKAALAPSEGGETDGK